ncbi:unnamed protein product [Durusdinium trenchii]|uniref:RNA-editing substrate-binding complex 6 protein domain-containing protein n=1 Tax=Durusdinium trenchii TaxID=1381693 RepID=A0ABP0K090_9DINO
MAEFSQYKTEELTPYAISRMVWGYACLSARNDPLMSILAAEVVKKIRGFKHQELANTAWAFAKCGLWNDQLARSLASQCLDQMEDFSTESLSSVAWAMAQWSTQEEGLLQKMGDSLLSKMETFEPGPMSTIAWAFSTLNFKHEKLTNAILVESTRKISSFSIKEVAHLAWAFANLRVPDTQLFSKIAEHVERSDAAMQPAEIANMAWALAKSHLVREPIMRRLAQEAVNQIGGFKAAEITMLTWACAVSNQKDLQLMLEIGSKVSQRCSKFTPPQLSHIIWAFGALGMRHIDLCESVAKCCQSAFVTTDNSGTSYNANSLTQVVWGFASVQYRNVSFMHEAAKYIIKSGVSALKPLALWRCASAYNSMLMNNKEIKQALVEACNKKNDFSLKGLTRLLECYTMCHPSPEQETLEQVLDARLEAVALQLSQLFTPSFPSDIPDPDPKILEFLIQSGLLDLQTQGLKFILKKLQFSTPSWSFMSKCLKNSRASSQLSKTLVIAEIAIAGLAPFMVTRSDKSACTLVALRRRSGLWKYFQLPRQMARLCSLRLRVCVQNFSQTMAKKVRPRTVASRSCCLRRFILLLPRISSPCYFNFDPNFPRSRFYLQKYC